MRSSLLARRSTLVRSVITSKGSSRAGAPEPKATTLPVTASTNATSRDTSCAAKGSSPQTMETTTATEATLGKIIGQPSTRSPNSVVSYRRLLHVATQVYRLLSFLILRSVVWHLDGNWVQKSELVFPGGLIAHPARSGALLLRSRSAYFLTAWPPHSHAHARSGKFELPFLRRRAHTRGHRCHIGFSGPSFRHERFCHRADMINDFA